MEDSHYCLKCGSTLIGLDNYINHRKAQCANILVDPPKVDLDAKVVSEREAPAEKVPEKVEADDFFSSLELQSSSKTSSNATNANVPSKLSTGIVTRSKLSYQEISNNKANVKSRGSKVEAEMTKKRKRKKKRKLLSPRKSSSKKSIGNKDKKETGVAQKKLVIEEENLGRSPDLDRSKVDDDWALFNQLGLRKDLEEKGTSIRRYTPELFAISPMLMTDEFSDEEDAEVNKLLENEEYDDGDTYLNLEGMDELNYAPPRSHTGGKWKPGSLSARTSPMLWVNQTWDSLLEERQQDEDGRQSESPTDLSSGGKTFTSSGGKWKSYNPPSTHTGGKWRPSEAPQTAKKPSQSVPPASFTGGKWHPGKRMPPTESPPATHTGGKWKPQITPGSQKTESDIAPPEESRGKWVPSTSKSTVDNKTLNVIASCQSTSGKCLKTAGGLIQYYCSPCNRRLASKKIYKKHVLSELHLKRVLQENELEFDSRSIKLFRGLFSVMNNKQRRMGKRAVKKPEYFKDMEMGSSGRKDATSDGIKRKRLTRRELIRCDVCKAKLVGHQLGKHLVSYYHSRRIRLNEPEQQKLVLDNIHAIVKQAPYQCGICKFYFNTHALFKEHWISEKHRLMEAKEGRKFWCVLCNFETDTSRSMELHLDSNSHREVILAVNKSIPIIIRQKQILACKHCNKTFRYNFSLNRHCRAAHGVSESESVTNHQCTDCKLKFKTMKALQRHVLRGHKGKVGVPYFCSACNLYFDTAEESKAHRRSQTHRLKILKLRPDESERSMLSRQCPYCPSVLEDIDELKSHINDLHPELRPSCSKCGKVFALSQQVAQHNKDQTCEFVQESAAVDLPGNGYRCSRCAYSSTSKSDILYHEILHEKPLIMKDCTEKVPCPFCGKSFRMFTLKVHLRSHTKERPYQCKICSKTFIRKNRLANHLKRGHKDECPTPNAEKAEKATVDEGLKKRTDADFKPVDGRRCNIPKCRYTPKHLEDLEYHIQVHVDRKLFQCPMCKYQTRTNTLFQRHNKIHLDERSHPCPHCSFRGRLSSHLKRHLRVHTGAKPYKCPHCPYSCNILENLRKHVLFTKIHPGKKLYECKMCEFATNTSRTFKQHLLDSHRDKFGTEVAVTSYVAGIYNMDEDTQVAVNPVPANQRDKEEVALVPPPPSQPQPPPPQNITSSFLIKVLAIMPKKFEPIAPKPTTETPMLEGQAPEKLLLEKPVPEKPVLEKPIPEREKPIPPREPEPQSKASGNSVENKRKQLEMELEKLKIQVRKMNMTSATASMPKDSVGARAPASESEKKARTEPNTAEEPAKRKKFGSSTSRSENIQESTPTFVHYESGISFAESGDQLAGQEFYLFGNYND